MRKRKSEMSVGRKMGGAWHTVRISIDYLTEKLEVHGIQSAMLL